MEPTVFLSFSSLRISQLSKTSAINIVRSRPGVIAEGGVVLRAFARIGWGWGGRWSGARDYQHLSASGR